MSAPEEPSNPNVGDPEETTDSSGNDTAKEAAAGAAVGAGIGAAFWGVAMPAANFIGFGANGIAAGSTAAAWMSSAAVANGGGVAAGSAVATMQSIGAVGLATPVGLGLVAAGVVVGGAAIGVKKLMSKGDPGEEEITIDGETPGEGKKLKAAEEPEQEGKEAPKWLLLEWLSPTAKPIKTTFTDEKEAREAYANSYTRKKQLTDPDGFCVESTQ